METKHTRFCKRQTAELFKMKETLVCFTKSTKVELTLETGLKFIDYNGSYEEPWYSWLPTKTSGDQSERHAHFNCQKSKDRVCPMQNKQWI